MSDAQISDEDGATFDFLLTSAGSTRIAVYKAVNDTQMIGMKQARALVDAAPTTVAAGLDASQARRLQAALELAGAEFELVRHGGASVAETPPSADSTIDQIRKLGDLRSEGLLTDDEFEAKKAELLKRI
jgi:hypothetical protein